MKIIPIVLIHLGMCDRLNYVHVLYLTHNLRPLLLSTYVGSSPQAYDKKRDSSVQDCSALSLLSPVLLPSRLTVEDEEPRICSLSRGVRVMLIQGPQEEMFFQPCAWINFVLEDWTWIDVFLYLHKVFWHHYWQIPLSLCLCLTHDTEIRT